MSIQLTPSLREEVRNRASELGNSPLLVREPFYISRVQEVAGYVAITPIDTKEGQVFVLQKEGIPDE